MLHYMCVCIFERAYSRERVSYTLIYTYIRGGSSRWVRTNYLVLTLLLANYTVVTKFSLQGGVGLST